MVYLDDSLPGFIVPLSFVLSWIVVFVFVFLLRKSYKVNSLRKNVWNGDYHCLNDDDDDILNVSVNKEVCVDIEHSSTVDSNSDDKKQCKEGDVLHI